MCSVMESCSKMYDPFLFSSGHSKSRPDFEQDKTKRSLCFVWESNFGKVLQTRC